MSAGVECAGVHVARGGRPVLDGVDLTVTPGDWLAVVGPNGAGKTTLLHAVGGLLPATGRLRVGGHDPIRAGRRAMARTVALMPQQPVVPEGITVRHLIGLGRAAHRGGFGTETATDRGVVAGTIERLQLEELADRPVTEVSGGELQRVMLARALAQQPRVLLLDEPTSALDIGHQQSVLDLVDALRVSDGITVLAAMHDLTLAGQYGRRVLLLHHGRVVADGTPPQVLRPELLAEVYGARVDVLAHSGGPAVLPLRAHR